MAGERTIRSGAVELAISEAGAGRPVVLLHGLTATRRYVVMGSRALERSGHRVIAYDARAHGASGPAPSPREYEYADLAGDLLAVLDGCEIESAVLAGASMGAHTALRVALERPERVAALVLITPAFEPAELEDEERLARWDALAAGLREGGVEGFVAAYGEPPPQWRDTLLTVLRQRIGAQQHPQALADALEVVPRSAPFERLSDLGDVAAPAIVVGDRDEADPGHPLAIAERYAALIPGARLEVEAPGESPLAWQGGRLSRLIAEAGELGERR